MIATIFTVVTSVFMVAMIAVGTFSAVHVRKNRVQLEKEFGPCVRPNAKITVVARMTHQE